MGMLSRHHQRLLFVIFLMHSLKKYNQWDAQLESLSHTYALAA